MTSSNESSTPDYRKRANWAVKIVALSIGAGIVLSVLIGYVVNEVWK